MKGTMTKQRRWKIDYIDMSDELLGIIQVFLGCGNDPSLGNLLMRFPRFPQAPSFSILDYYQFSQI